MEKFVVLGVSPAEWAWVEPAARERVAEESVEVAVQVTTVRKYREQGGREWVAAAMDRQQMPGAWMYGVHCWRCQSMIGK